MQRQHRNVLLAAMEKELTCEEMLQPILLMETLLETTAFQLFRSVKKTSRVPDLFWTQLLFTILNTIA